MIFILFTQRKDIAIPLAGPIVSIFDFAGTDSG